MKMQSFKGHLFAAVIRLLVEFLSNQGCNGFQY